MVVLAPALPNKSQNTFLRPIWEFRLQTLGALMVIVDRHHLVSCSNSERLASCPCVDGIPRGGDASKIHTYTI